MVRHRQSGVGRGVQNHIGSIAVGGLEGSIDQWVHDLLKLQQPLRIVAHLLQGDALLYQHPFDLTAQFFGETR